MRACILVDCRQRLLIKWFEAVCSIGRFRFTEQTKTPAATISTMLEGSGIVPNICTNEPDPWATSYSDLKATKSAWSLNLSPVRSPNR